METVYSVRVNTNVEISTKTIERAVRNLICDSGYDCSHLSVTVEQGCRNIGQKKEFERRTTPEGRKKFSELEDMLRSNPALKDITSEQKKALSDMQLGDLMDFTKMLKSTKGDIDLALQVVVNTVEGDRSQLPDSLVDYAEKKGWIEGNSQGGIKNG